MASRVRIAPFLVPATLTLAFVIFMVAPLYLATTSNLANMSTVAVFAATTSPDEAPATIPAPVDDNDLATNTMSLTLDDEPVPEFNSASKSPSIYQPFTHLVTLSPESIPTRTNGKRLIIVGDVHGMRPALESLLESIEFDGGLNDRVILAGDLVDKGPDNAGVVDFARQIGALGVRGNHEDKILRRVGRKAIEKEPKNKGGDEDAEPDNDEEILVPEKELKSLKKKHKHKKDGLKRKHLRWLADLPLILHIGEVEGMGDLVVVHAGLVPGVALEKQDPWAILNMRSLIKHDGLNTEEAEEEPLSDDNSSAEDDDMSEIDLKPRTPKARVPVDGHNGQSWSRAWNAFQRTVPRRHRTTVLYGHDAKRGLHIKRYTMGIDSGCVRGDRLTAVVIEGTAEAVTHRIVHVECGDIEW